MAIALAASAVAADGPNQKFTCDMKTYVPFDATTTVTVECPDPADWIIDYRKAGIALTCRKLQGKGSPVF